MKHLLTFLAIGFTFLASAQSNNPQGWSNYDFPFNPDANNDNAIGSEDLLQLLGVYGNEYGMNPPPCDYEATSLEELWAGVLTGIIEIDSMFYEIEMSDVVLTYVPGCPEQVYDTLNLVFNGIFDNFSASYTTIYSYNASHLVESSSSNYANSFRFQFDTETGKYRAFWSIVNFDPYTTLGYFNSVYGDAEHGAYSPWLSLPLPTTYVLDEDGIDFGGISGWCSVSNPTNGSPCRPNWVDFVTSYSLIPYWHYVE